MSVLPHEIQCLIHDSQTSSAPPLRLVATHMHNAHRGVLSVIVVTSTIMLAMELTPEAAHYVIGFYGSLMTGVLDRIGEPPISAFLSPAAR
jgi:hypothetical protein